MTTNEVENAVGRVNRRGWPTGPWDGEPDQVQWTDGETGMVCLAIRNELGHWCGYVGVPEIHPDYGKGYDDLDTIEVHGGLTYAEAGDGKLRPAELYWFGFDCAHAWDVGPGMLRYRSPRPVPDGLPGEVYRDLGYVQDECRSLANQLARRAADS